MFITKKKHEAITNHHLDRIDYYINELYLSELRNGKLKSEIAELKKPTKKTVAKKATVKKVDK